MDISLGIVNQVLADNMGDSIEFREFCNNLDTMKQIMSTKLYLSEAVNNVGSKSKLTTQKIVNDTVQTTRDAAKVYGMTTDAGGSLIKAGWDLMMKLLGLAAKAIAFTVSKIILIPAGISKLIDLVAAIPTEIKVKIRGDIKLYITVNDIQPLYDNLILHHIFTFLNLAEQLSKGDRWTSFFDRDKDGNNKPISPTDMKLIRSMKAEYNYFQSMQFSQTIVNMNDPKTVEMYFGTGKINYKDLKGTTHNETYYESLSRLAMIISNRKSKLDNIQTMIGEKFQRTQNNQTFANLSILKRQTVINVMEMISKAVELLGNMVRYIITDINTIKKTTRQILDSKNKLSKSEDSAKKKLIGRDENVTKDMDINENPSNDYEYDEKMKKRGLVKVQRIQRNKNGNVIKEIEGEEDKFDKSCVWIKKEDRPRGVKIVD